MKNFHLTQRRGGGNRAVHDRLRQLQRSGKDEFQTFLEGSRAAENIEKTNNPSIDAIAGSSTIIYKRVGGAMREYIEQVRGDMATILLGRQIRNLDTTDEAGVEIAGRILQGLTEAEKKTGLQKNCTRRPRKNVPCNIILQARRKMKSAPSSETAPIRL